MFPIKDLFVVSKKIQTTLVMTIPLQVTEYTKINRYICTQLHQHLEPLFQYYKANAFMFYSLICSNISLIAS